MNPFLVLDVETGGLNPEETPMTEIAFNIYDPKNYKLIESYQTYIQPYNDLVIDMKVLAKTQVTMQDIEGGKTIDVVMKEITGIWGKYNKVKKNKLIMVGHNIPFDIRFVKYAFDYKMANLYDFIDESHFCTQRLMKFAERKDKNADKLLYRLAACCDRMGISLKNAHGAQADIQATFDLFKKLTINIGQTGDTYESTNSKRDPARNFFEF